MISSDYITFRTIEIVQEVYRTGSFSKAAERLFISQPALSQYVRRCESALGCPLFIRGKNTVTLTDAGMLLLQKGESLLLQRNLLAGDLEQLAGLQRNRLCIGWPHCYTKHYFPRILKSLSRTEPSLTLEAEEHTLETLQEKLLADELDIILAPVYFHNPHFTYRVITKEHLLLAVPKDHPINTVLEQQPEFPCVNLRHLSGMPFISIKDSPAYTDFLSPLFEEAGYQPMTIFQCVSWDTCDSLVNNGLGLSIVPHMLAHESPDKNILYYPIQSSRCKTYRIFSFVYKTDRGLTPAEQTFLNITLKLLGDENAGKSYDELAL